LHPFGVAKSSTSFGFGKGGNVTSAEWQVTVCDDGLGSRNNIDFMTFIKHRSHYALTDAWRAFGTRACSWKY